MATMRLLPSQVASAMASGAFAQVWPNNLEFQVPGYVSFVHLGPMRQLAELLNAIPDELIVGDEQVPVLMGRAAVNGFVEQCQSLGKNAGHLSGDVIHKLYHALKKLPDRVPVPLTPELGFIDDSDLRLSIREDLASVETSLRDADWKAATVMAGSAAEAMLLWRVQREDLSRVAAVAATVPSDKKPPSEPADWSLHLFIEVARKLDLIHEVTAQQLRIAKGFRNLIHPGRMQRTREKCDRGTAYAAVAALQFLIRDFS